MAKLTFLGAAGTVTGSRFLLETSDTTILVDCGSFQGTKELRLRNWEPFPVPAASIDRVLLTHAHIDHTGHLPRLCKEGFSGPVHSTHATADLCRILLRDSAHLQEEDAQIANAGGFSKHSPALPLYTIEDAEQALTLFQPHHYGEDIYLDGNLRLKFRDSGHILGSALIDLKAGSGREGRKVLFSGDLGRPDQPVLRDPSPVYNVDYLVLESTYGDRLHDATPPSEILTRVILESIDRGGVLVVPSFAVGRTQTLLYMIRDLEERGHIPVLPVYLDSPMSIRATGLFEDRITDLDITSRMLTLAGKHIFRPKNLQMCQSRQESMAINQVERRAIIISSSGMATGGRILHHLAQRLPNPANTILFIGYQAEGTRGRTILEGGSEVKIQGDMTPVRAKVESISGFSGHGDYREILAWLMGFNRAPQTTFVVHGEPSGSEAMAEAIRRQFGWNVVIPSFKETVDLEL